MPDMRQVRMQAWRFACSASKRQNVTCIRYPRITSEHPRALGIAAADDYVSVSQQYPWLIASQNYEFKFSQWNHPPEL